MSLVQPNSRGLSAVLPISSTLLLLHILLQTGIGGGQARGEEASRPVSFVGDVLPVLSKSGCSKSGCHSSPGGKNGFLLSVFSYDPRSDYDEIVREARGRRVSPASPDHSLFLLKPTQQVPHEGGERFAVDSQAYKTIRAWIASGMPYRLPDEPDLEEVEIVGDKNTRVVTKYSRGKLAVRARYSDGSRRDVTELAEFTSSNPDLVEIDEAGHYEVAKRMGEATMVARYMGKVASLRLSVPPDEVLPPTAYAGFRRANFIDAHAVARWSGLGLLPSERCDDSEFIRRASIDLIGTLPTTERVRAFLADATPDKRARLVDELLAHPNWADRWALVWADLLRPNPDRVGVKSVYVLDQWLRESFRRNKPYDRFAREILTVRGSTHHDGPAVIFRDRREPADVTTTVSQVFMGVRLECAKCHNHPNESWSQDDFYRLAAFFGDVRRKGTGVSPPISGSPEFVYHRPGGKVLHPVTQAVMPPRAPGAADDARVEAGADPRSALADWLTAPENPFFARAAVNRVWGAMMGTGIVNPVDDMRTSNPPSNPALLDALASDFAEHGFDMKQLMRRIANSSVYQRRSTPNETNVADTRHFSRAYRRRMSAEALTDAVADVTGVPNTFQGMPPEARALQAWNFKLASDTLDAFGRPDSSEDCPCERNLGTSVVQALHLMHSEGLQTKLAHKEGRVARLAGGDASVAEIVDELYLAAYARLPRDEERAIAEGVFAKPEATRQTATEDLLWALINSAEFVFNH